MDVRGGSCCYDLASAFHIFIGPLLLREQDLVCEKNNVQSLNTPLHYSLVTTGKLGRRINVAQNSCSQLQCIAFKRYFLFL